VAATGARSWALTMTALLQGSNRLCSIAGKQSFSTAMMMSKKKLVNIGLCWFIYKICLRIFIWKPDIVDCYYEYEMKKRKVVDMPPNYLSCYYEHLP
jgi:hypothetical protein